MTYQEQAEKLFHAVYDRVDRDGEIDDYNREKALTEIAAALQAQGERVEALEQELDATKLVLDSVYRALGLSGVESRPVSLYITDLHQQLATVEKELNIAMRQGGQARTELMLENRDLREQLATCETRMWEEDK